MGSDRKRTGVPPTKTNNTPDDWQEALIHALDTSPVGVLLTNKKGVIVYANQSILYTTGYQAEEILGHTPALFQSGRTSPTVYADLWATILSGHTWIGELENKTKRGDSYWIKATISPITDTAGQLTHFLEISEDVTHKRAGGTGKLFIASRDSVTGLPTPLLFRDRIDQLIDRTRQPDTTTSPASFAVIQLRIVDFQKTRATLGLAASNHLLNRIACTLQHLLTPGETLARAEGAGLLLLILTENSEDAARARYRQLTEAFSRLFHEDNIPDITFIAGGALFPGHATERDALLALSEEAVNLARCCGHPNDLVFISRNSTTVNAPVSLHTDITRALANNEFELFYQPQVSAVDGRVTGCEALIRWQHPEKGLIPPAQFIPEAEQQDLILPIGQWVLETALRQLKAWEPRLPGEFILAINLSPRQLDHPELLRQIETLANRYQVNPARLEFEVTESWVISHMETALQTLRELRKLGCSIAIDDFGTGYSNLSYLKQMPLDRLKIDRCFVQEMTRIAEDAQITRLIVQVAHTLGLKVVAEGVEEEAQCCLLQRFLVDDLQGFYFNRPVPADQFLAYLSADAHRLPVKDIITETLLVVDDEPAVLSAIKRLLRQSPYQVLMAETPEAALDLLARHSVSVILSDHRMPSMSGARLLALARVMYPDTVRMMLSGYADVETLKEAVNDGAIYRFLLKPWEDNELKRDIDQAFAQFRSNMAEKSRLLTDPGILGF